MLKHFLNFSHKHSDKKMTSFSRYVRNNQVGKIVPKFYYFLTMRLNSFCKYDFCSCALEIHTGDFEDTVLKKAGRRCTSWMWKGEKC